jgi:uncharacterized protein with beta-barrel porin domain
MVASLAGSSDALAQCATSGTDPVSLTCAVNTTTTSTTNVTSPNGSTSDRIQQFNADLNGQVSAAVTVDGAGLNLVTTKVGGGITFINSGTVSDTAGAPSAVQLDGSGGTVTYAGGGTISSTSTANSGLVINNTTGNILVNMTGGQIGTGAARVSRGIVATTTSGSIDLTSSPIFSINDGITAAVTAGTSGGITIHAGSIDTFNTGIVSSIVGGTGNTAITLNGNIASAGGGGIRAASSSTGSMSVGGTGNISTSAGGGAISVTNSATSTSGDITINPSGNLTSAPFPAILAQITNAANNANIIVTPTGTVSGGDTGGTAGVITARTAGGGNVTVTTANNVSTVIGPAISTTTTSGTNTVNITGGIVQAAVGGEAVDATSASGRIVVSNAGTILGGTIGIDLIGGSASAVNNNGTITSAIGVSATAGAASVFNAGTITGTGGTAVQFAGTGNTLTIAPTSVIGGNALGTGQDLLQLGGSGTGSFNAASIGPAAQYRGFGAFAKVGDSTWTLSGNNALVLPWTVQQGLLNVAGSLTNSSFTVQAGALSVTGTIGSAIVNGGTFSIPAAGLGGPVTVNGGTASIVGAINSATVNNGNFSVLAGGLGGPVTVNGGTASIGGTINMTAVNGGLLSVLAGGVAGATSVNGGVLTGNGTVGTTQINSGGTFAPGTSGTPGTSLTVAGNLAFQSGAIYLVQVNPSTASLANVTGTAALAGNVLVALTPGNYVRKQYDILHATALGNTFAGASSNVPGFAASLSYTNTDVFLNLSAALGGSGRAGGLSGNQQNVANAINNFFNGGGALPPGFSTLFGLSGGSLANALGQLSGEIATTSQQSTFNAMNLFMGLMTDPFIAGRGNPVSAGGGTTRYADEQGLGYAAKRNPNDALAAIYGKAPVAADPFAQRWSVWAAGYGGSQTTNGNAVLGSNNTTSNLYGTAVGADYRLSPDTLAGFALAGGGTNFSVANGLGSGRSDLFQAGAFVRHTMGAAYLSGALAYGWQDITTNRTLTIAGLDQLQAKFNANAWSGRVEGGYRFVAPGLAIGLTPYAAGQFTTFDLPAYAEQAISGANTFALAYGAKSVTATRSELGLRTDKSFAMEDGVFTLRGRAAWAHDYNPDRSIGATFQTLPGASFVVNGARQASDAVLLTASAEKKWLNGWSAAGTFEGEFSSVTTSYAGKGVVRYSW